MSLLDVCSVSGLRNGISSNYLDCEHAESRSRPDFHMCNGCQVGVRRLMSSAHAASQMYISNESSLFSHHKGPKSYDIAMVCAIQSIEGSAPGPSLTLR